MRMAFVMKIDFLRSSHTKTVNKNHTEYVIGFEECIYVITGSECNYNLYFKKYPNNNVSKHKHETLLNKFMEYILSKEEVFHTNLSLLDIKYDKSFQDLKALWTC